MKTVIVKNLSKRYEVRARSGDEAWNALLFGHRGPRREIFAVKNVSFEVGGGEAFGVVGENGAGKTTLLRLLMGVTRPTSGSVEVQGRVSALIELGAGFHGEFSGRENAMLNAALLGMQPLEAKEKYEGIVRFSELGDFMEWPVRTYSAGMKMRLGFSVATSVDPAVLLVDEVLSVGDRYFEKKCIDRIYDFLRLGKTIVFCSHDLYRVTQVCKRAIWLRAGENAAEGGAYEVCDRYRNYMREKERGQAPPRPVGEPPAPDRGGARISGVKLYDAEGKQERVFETGEFARLVVEFETDNEEVPVEVGVMIRRNDGEDIFGTATHLGEVRPFRNGKYGRVALILDPLNLLAGEYLVSVYLQDENGVHIYDKAESVLDFTIPLTKPFLGVGLIEHSWVHD